MGHQLEHMYNMYFMIANQFVKKNFVFLDYFSSNLVFFKLYVGLGLQPDNKVKVKYNVEHIIFHFAFLTRKRDGTNSDTCTICIL